MKAFSTKTNEEIYLEWLNDYVTVQSMANNYNMPVIKLATLINKGRDEHLQKFASPAYKKQWGII